MSAYCDEKPCTGQYATAADEALRVADAGLAINPNYASALCAIAASPKMTSANSNKRNPMCEQAMRLSPRDPDMGAVGTDSGATRNSASAHFDAAIEEYHKAIDAGYAGVVRLPRTWPPPTRCKGKMDEAKAALAEARRLNPKLTRQMADRSTAQSASRLIDGLRKAGLPEE